MGEGQIVHTDEFWLIDAEGMRETENHHLGHAVNIATGKIYDEYSN